MKHLAKTILLLAASCAFCIGMAPCAFAASTADASESIDTTRECSLTLNYEYAEKAFPGVKVQLYHVADLSGDFTAALTPEFVGCPVDVRALGNQEAWALAKHAVATFIAQKGMQPAWSGVTDEKGAISFVRLPVGIYYVQPVGSEAQEGSYLFDSAFFHIPLVDEAGLLNYDVRAYPKAEFKPAGSSDNKGKAGGEARKSAVTGDEAPLFIVLGAVLISVGFLMSLALRSKSKGEKDRQED